MEAAQLIEELDLSRVCIPKLAQQNKNNGIVSTTKICISPEDDDCPTGQMSFWAKIKYVITPGKDKTAETHPTGNRNCDMVIKKMHQKFLEQMRILDEVAKKHALDNRHIYWKKDHEASIKKKGHGLTDDQVLDKHRPLIVEDDEGDLMFNTKLKPPVRKNKQGEIVKSANGTVMVEVLSNGEDAEVPTSIDEVHCDPQKRDEAQLVCRFVCFYKTATKFGINPHCPQGWHRRVSTANFKRNRVREPKPVQTHVVQGKRGHDDVASSTTSAAQVGQEDLPRAAQPRVQTEQGGGGEAADATPSKDVGQGDEFDDVDDYDDYE